MCVLYGHLVIMGYLGGTMERTWPALISSFQTPKKYHRPLLPRFSVRFCSPKEFRYNKSLSTITTLDSAFLLTPLRHTINCNTLATQQLSKKKITNTSSSSSSSFFTSFSYFPSSSRVEHPVTLVGGGPFLCAPLLSPLTERECPIAAS